MLNDGPKLGLSINGVIVRMDYTIFQQLLWPGETVVDEVLMPITQHGIYMIEVQIIASTPTQDVTISAVKPLAKEDLSVAFATSIYFDTRMAVSSAQQIALVQGEET